jgi:hypothetical protein
MHPFIAFASFFLLAGQGQFSHRLQLLSHHVIIALSLSIAVGGSLGTIDASQFLNVTDTYLLTDVTHFVLSLLFDY